MDVLGLTFEEIRERLGLAAHELKPVRKAYRRLLCGAEDPSRPNDQDADGTSGSEDPRAADATQLPILQAEDAVESGRETGDSAKPHIQETDVAAPPEQTTPLPLIEDGSSSPIHDANSSASSAGSATHRITDPADTAQEQWHTGVRESHGHGITDPADTAREQWHTGDRESPERAVAEVPGILKEPLTAHVGRIVRRQEDGELTKFVQRTADGLEVESVLVPMQRWGRRWKTLCVSSQVGCARGCTFCETAQLGLLRNLTPAEIVGQVVAARRVLGEPVRNVVFMGMGEPFDNFEAVTQAIRVLLDRSALSFAGERITLSTVGRIKGIERLASLGWRRVNLAISLNAPNDEIRREIMPIAKTDPMEDLRAALLAYPLRKCQFFMMEYVLIPGVNHAYEHAAELVEFLRPVKCVVNVIPYNPRQDSPWPAPTEAQVQQFIGWIKDLGQNCKRRLTKGRDHMAACGQLGNRELRAARQRG
jgi:23S rRNA (adenine2503-C2)-methyltransferase